MSIGLDDILSATRRHVETMKAIANVCALEQRALAHQPRGFRCALAGRAKAGPAIIAELKKASPSKGLIRPEFHAKALATELEAAGAAALSVLTDEPYFHGSLQNLELASDATQIPCLRKDFILDGFQVLEARAHGADAILLIVAALEEKQLAALQRDARELELDVLCEVHNAEELKCAAGLGFEVIGVNNRDLRTFRVDVETSYRLAEAFPKETIRVAESGIEERTQIQHLRAAGYHGFLVGESLMRAPEPGKVLGELLS